MSPDARKAWLDASVSRLLTDAHPGAEQKRLIREVRDIIREKDGTAGRS